MSSFRVIFFLKSLFWFNFCILCISDVGMGELVLLRTTLRNLFSSSAFRWVWGIKLRLPGLCGKCLYLLSHVVGPSLFTDWQSCPCQSVPGLWCVGWGLSTIGSVFWSLGWSHGVLLAVSTSATSPPLSSSWFSCLQFLCSQILGSYLQVASYQIYASILRELGSYETSFLPWTLCMNMTHITLLVYMYIFLSKPCTSFGSYISSFTLWSWGLNSGLVHAKCSVFH